MAHLRDDFQSDQYADMRRNEPIPKGSYIAHIIASDYIPNKSKNGHLLQLTHEILQGEYKGHQIYTNLNLDNPNLTAVKIAKESLATLCRACERQSITDSVSLHFKIHCIDVDVKPPVFNQDGSERYSAQNKIVFFSAMPANPADEQGNKQDSLKPSDTDIQFTQVQAKPNTDEETVPSWI